MIFEAGVLCPYLYFISLKRKVLHVLPGTPLRIYTNRIQKVNNDFLSLKILSVPVFCSVYEVTTCLAVVCHSTACSEIERK